MTRRGEAAQVLGPARLDGRGRPQRLARGAELTGHGADQCQAPAQGSRPLFVCQKVVRKFGPLARFASPEGELDAASLARCNG